MSELKAYLCEKASEIEVREFLCYRFKLEAKPAIEPVMEEVYIKSEADEVIAELKSKLEAKALELYNLKEDALNTDKAREKWFQLARKQAMEIRHQKYKRCLDKAERCRLEQERIELIECQDITDDDFNKLAKGFYKKWRKRWIKIAEKFKEAKNETGRN